MTPFLKHRAVAGDARVMVATSEVWDTGAVNAAAWGEVAVAIGAAPYPMTVLPADAAAAEECLSLLEITTRSWLGAVVANSGGLVVDHGWLHVLGSGHGGLPSVASANPASGWLVVAYDVLGGRFAWVPARPRVRPTIHYFGPDVLEWQGLGQGYADWLYAVLAGSLTRFYDTLRWPGWETEVAAVALDHGLNTFPPPWTVEGKDLATVSRRAAPMMELAEFHLDTAHQLGRAGD